MTTETHSDHKETQNNCRDTQQPQAQKQPQRCPHIPTQTDFVFHGVGKRHRTTQDMSSVVFSIFSSLGVLSQRRRGEEKDLKNGGVEGWSQEA